MGNFRGRKVHEQIEIPPNKDSRRFNECDIIGDLDRDEKGNVITDEIDPKVDHFVDK